MRSTPADTQSTSCGLPFNPFSEVTVEKQPYVVCYDYGTGGLWAVVMARSEEEIHREYPELVTVRERPKWMTEDDYRDLLDRECHDIDGQPWGVLDAVLADRGREGGPERLSLMDDSTNLGDRVTEILGPWLTGEGFHVVEAGKRAARWARPDGVAVQFECYEEDPPPRPLGVALGETDADGSFTAVGAWALVPDDASGSEYSLWRFGTRQELDHVLRRIQAEVIQPFLAPYWRQPGRLREVIEAAEQLRRSRYEDEQDQQGLAAARAAFATGYYVRSSELYGLAREALSDSDRQRVKIARRELGLDDQ